MRIAAAGYVWQFILRVLFFCVQIVVELPPHITQQEKLSRLKPYFGSILGVFVAPILIMRFG